MNDRAEEGTLAQEKLPESLVTAGDQWMSTLFNNPSSLNNESPLPPFNLIAQHLFSPLVLIPFTEKVEIFKLLDSSPYTSGLHWSETPFQLEDCDLDVLKFWVQLWEEKDALDVQKIESLFAFAYRGTGSYKQCRFLFYKFGIPSQQWIPTAEKYIENDKIRPLIVRSFFGVSQFPPLTSKINLNPYFLNDFPTIFRVIFEDKLKKETKTLITNSLKEIEHLIFQMNEKDSEKNYFQLLPRELLKIIIKTVGSSFGAVELQIRFKGSRSFRRKHHLITLSHPPNSILPCALILDDHHLKNFKPPQGFPYDIHVFSKQQLDSIRESPIPYDRFKPYHFVLYSKSLVKVVPVYHAYFWSPLVPPVIECESDILKMISLRYRSQMTTDYPYEKNPLYSILVGHLNLSHEMLEENIKEVLMFFLQHSQLGRVHMIDAISSVKIQTDQRTILLFEKSLYIDK